MKKNMYEKNNSIGKWRLIKFIASGGHSEVWETQNEHDEKLAIKILKNSQNKIKRFCDEIKTVVENQDTNKLILPIIDYNIDDKTIPYYYVMPYAETIDKYLVDKDSIVVVKAIIEIAKGLKCLHEKKIFHRDIKPINLFRYKESYCIGDFGLVHYPTKDDITLNNKKVGPEWTIAPEMRRNPQSADLEKADVYSLSKTLWILLTKEAKGFDGQYIKKSSIELINYLSGIYRQLDELLTDSTDNDPQNRPSLSCFIKKLQEFVDSEKDFRQKNRINWMSICKNIYECSFPSRCIWENKDDIIKIMNLISNEYLFNHTFLPDGGGLDLIEAKISHEDECIELILDGVPKKFIHETDYTQNCVYLIKPKRLILETFDDDIECNYFRLETGFLIPIKPNR